MHRFVIFKGLDIKMFSFLAVFAIEILLGKSVHRFLMKTILTETYSFYRKW